MSKHAGANCLVAIKEIYMRGITPGN